MQYSLTSENMGYLNGHDQVKEKHIIKAISTDAAHQSSTTSKNASTVKFFRLPVKPLQPIMYALHMTIALFSERFSTSLYKS